MVVVDFSVDTEPIVSGVVSVGWKLVEVYVVLVVLVVVVR